MYFGKGENENDGVESYRRRIADRSPRDDWVHLTVGTKGRSWACDSLVMHCDCDLVSIQD